MPDFIGGPAFDIGRRLEIRAPFSWLALLGPTTDDGVAREDLATELGAVLEAPVRVVRYSGSTEALRSDLLNPASDPVIIWNLEIADAEQWSALDINRSGLVREGPVILWLSSDSLTLLCAHAPNVRSFGSSEEFVGYLVHLGRASVHSNTLPDRASRRGQIGE